MIIDKVKNKAADLQTTLAGHAQMRYLNWIMQEENCTYDEALAIVSGRTDPQEPEYILGYQLADPVLQIALFAQARKTKRDQAAQNFARSLPDDLAAIFWKDVYTDEGRKKFLKKYKQK